jgi:aminoglycoside 3-N-acetyltransferase
MTTYRDLVTAFRKLDLDSSLPVIAHASLSSFNDISGGAETLLGALLSSFGTVVMPTFTYKTMVIPEIGLPDNAVIYGSGNISNRLVEIFDPEMPVDRLIGAVPEALRHHKNAQRSSHPILSFAGINADECLSVQTLSEPLAPIRVLHEKNGWILLLGVDHKVNTSIHYAERLAGRKTFIRWALTQEGIVECPGFPGCSDGFETIAPLLQEITNKVEIGNTPVQAIPIPEMIEIIREMLLKDPLALLCNRDYCERCDAIRSARKNHQ